MRRVVPGAQICIDRQDGSLKPLICRFEPRRALRMPAQLLICVLLARSYPGPVFGQEVKVYVSSRAGDRLTPKPPIQFERQKKASVPLFRILTGNMFQKMAGFGASFFEAGMICLNDLPRPQQEAVLRSLFDPDQGAGFSAMKTPIAATDFMSAGPWYSYDETPGDISMSNFSVQRDLGPNGLITYIRRARQYGKFALEASMDYPPDWMLIDVEKNQDVDPKYYDALSRYYLRYVQEYQRHGVSIDYVSLFNEPRTEGRGYTRISYAEICELLKNHVGPLFKRENAKNRIMVSEAPDRQGVYEQYPTVLNDMQAREFATALPYHGYDFLKHLVNFDKIAAIHEAYADLPLWMTEVSYAYEAGTPHSKPLPCYDFEDGAFWGDMIVSDIEAGASAWIYRNMILDQHGAPWLVSHVHRDPDPNVQQPVVIINQETRKVYYTGLYYYLMHFSKFVRPGAFRVLMEGEYPGLRGVAFLSPAAEGGWYWVAELLNDRGTKTQVQVDFELDWLRRSLRLTLPEISITTCIWKPLPHTLGNMPAK